MATARIDYTSIPARALRATSRNILAMYLNPQQVIPTKSKIPRDYRGLADLMEIEHIEVLNLPAGDYIPGMLKKWETQSGATFAKLIEFLETLERFDIIDIISESLDKDAECYLRKMTLVQEIPLQVSEVSSQFSSEESLKLMTVDDFITGDCTCYDVYICYADEDVAFVFNLTRLLESWGIKVFIKDRNSIAGLEEYETHARLISERCNKMLLVITPYFLDSPACGFYAKYAHGLALEQRKRSVVPLIVEKIDRDKLMILRGLSTIDLTTSVFPQWTYNRLYLSLKHRTSASESSTCSLKDKTPPAALGNSPSDVENLKITFPSHGKDSSSSDLLPSVSSCSMPSLPHAQYLSSSSNDMLSLSSLTSSSSCISTLQTTSTISLPDDPIESSTVATKPPENVNISLISSDAIPSADYGYCTNVSSCQSGIVTFPTTELLDFTKACQRKDDYPSDATTELRAFTEACQRKDDFPADSKCSGTSKKNIGFQLKSFLRLNRRNSSNCES